MKIKPDAILFDLDGVLINSVDAWFLMVDDFSVTGALYPPLEVDADGPYEAFEGESGFFPEHGGRKQKGGGIKGPSNLLPEIKKTEHE